SSTGRLDVFTRLMTEDGSEFESVPEGYHGPLYLEIAPRTFSVVARTGTRLAQLRFVRGGGQTSDGALPDRKIEGLHEAEALVHGADAVIARGLWISVDLRGTGGENGLIGYRARPHAPLVDLDRVAAYDALDFWEPIVDAGTGRLILNP